MIRNAKWRNHHELIFNQAIRKILLVAKLPPKSEISKHAAADDVLMAAEAME